MRTLAPERWQRQQIDPQMEWIVSDVAKIDRILDEALVNLGAMVLRLADPAVTRSTDERRALAASVRQYSRCADKSTDPHVQELRNELEKLLKPHLKLVWTR
jgi:hypothetical protein